MTESETESETIDRLEVALRKIATAAHAAKATAAHAAKTSAAHAAKLTAAHAAKTPPALPPAAQSAPQFDTEALKQSLDMLIARLRAGLTPPPHHAVTE